MTKKILIINLGQLGDVVLSLPSLLALRKFFSKSHITIISGLPQSKVIELAQCADEVIPLDRHKLKKAPKLSAISEIFRLIKYVRKQHYDLVVDLHAFYETGLLAWISGAPRRIGPQRQRRSLNFFYTIDGPLEKSNQHVSDRYADIVESLGIPVPDRNIKLPTPENSTDIVQQYLSSYQWNSKDLVIGFYTGAGHSSRVWPAEYFAQLGSKLIEKFCCKLLILDGPEEAGLAQKIASKISIETNIKPIVLSELPIPELLSIISSCTVFISNDTGPAHLSAAIGTPTVVLMGDLGPSLFAIQGDAHRLIYATEIFAITVNEVFEIACERLSSRDIVTNR